MREFLVVVLGFLLLSGGIVSGIYVLKKAECSSRAEIYQTQYKFSVMAGCFLEREGRLIHEDHYRVSE